MVSGNKILSNLVWRFMERCGAQLVTLLVSIVLARLLDPAVYGMIALVTVITTILQVFVDGGFATALIQKNIRWNNWCGCNWNNIRLYRIRNLGISGANVI